jgi:predicted ATPase
MEIVLEIENLGNLKHAILKIRDLNIFVGKNNTNKTWTAYLLHAISSEIMIEKYIDQLVWENIPTNYSLNKFALFASKMKKKEIEPVEIEKFLAEIEIDKILEDYLIFVSREIASFLSLERKLFEKFKVSLKWQKEQLQEVIPLLREEFIYSLKSDSIDKCMGYYWWADPPYCYLKLLLSAIIRILVGNTFNLPIERNVLIHFSNLITLGEGEAQELLYSISSIRDDLLKLLNKEKSQENKKAIKAILKEINDLARRSEYLRSYNYPYPVREFKDFVQRIPSLSVKDRPLNKELLFLLEEIINGKISITTSGFSYKTENVTLPVSTSSSMVKSISGLYAYLAYRAEKNDFLIVDEPESNLHPEAQVKTIELFSIMANRGIKVLATTHSPYIVDHLINLIEAGEKKKKVELSPEKVELFFLKREEAFIAKEKVSVYFFKENGEVLDILKEDGTIDWRTFSTISEKISEIYYRL